MKLLHLMCAAVLLVPSISEAAPEFVEPTAAKPAKQEPVIAVPAFKNATRGNSSGSVGLPENASSVAADAASEALANTRKFRVLSRSSSVISSVDEETAFQATAGSTEAAEFFQELSNMNAQYVLMGRINSFRVDETSGSAYGVRRLQLVSSVSIDLQLINISTHEIVASKCMTERVVRRIPQGVEHMTAITDWEPILRKAIHQGVPEFIQSVSIGRAVEEGADEEEETPKKAAAVSMSIDSTPSGADVEFDGEYVGSTPCQVTLPGKKAVMKISAPGYETWSKVLKPNPQMKIKPTLRKSE